MNKSKYTCIFILLALINISCEKEINSNFINEDRKIVLSAIMEPDSLFTVYLSESLYPNESFFNSSGPTGSYKGIDDAVVSLFIDGVLISELESTGNGRFIAQYFPQTNLQYTIKTVTNDYPGTQSTSNLPIRIPIDSVKLTGDLSGQDIYYDLQMKLYLNDPSGEKNYYYLVVLYNYYKLDIENFAGRDVFTSNDLVFLDHINAKQYYIFNDDLFDGEPYILNLDVTTNTDAYYDSIQYYFYLCSLNSDFYQYLNSYNEFIAVTDNENNPLPLTEPVQFYNNIQNGFGIFGGYQVSIDSLLYVRK